MTLASIVEKETGKASERRTIAGVYCNRLKIGMKLDADPTVIYPVTKGKPLGRRILRSELNADTGYNTYARPGLPLGPDRQPGPRQHRRGARPGADQRDLFRRRRHRRACLRRHLRRASAQCAALVRDPPRNGVRCEEPGHRPRPDVRRRLPAVRGGDRLDDRVADEPARRIGRRPAPSMCAKSIVVYRAQLARWRRSAWRRWPLSCCSRRGARTPPKRDWAIGAADRAADGDQPVPAVLADELGRLSA